MIRTWEQRTLYALRVYNVDIVPHANTVFVGTCEKRAYKLTVH
jgi:hypothetical protein